MLDGMGICSEKSQFWVLSKIGNRTLIVSQLPSEECHNDLHPNSYSQDVGIAILVSEK